MTLAEVSAYPIICLPEGTGVRAVFDQACAAQGVQPDIALQASAPAAVADLAARDLGVAILTASMAASYGSRLTALALNEIQTAAILALIWTAATENPARRELLRYSREALSTQGSPQRGKTPPAGAS